ncbi:MAG: deaminase [Ponticaulis sp.]|nr:deaminase [Ponticaulis sp.]
MTSAHVYIGISLDGFIARKDDQIDWLDAFDVEGEEHGYDAFMEEMDVVVMGRRTYEKVLTFGFWPFSKPVVVLSNTLTGADVPDENAGKAEFFTGSPQDVLAHLDSKGWSKAYLDGGQVIQSFLRDGLVSDMILTRLPILIGEGLSLFGPVARDVRLEHIETKSFSKSGFVQSRYKVLNGAD